MGEQFGPYELIGRIGSGGMADVYLGQRAGVGGFSRICAVKRMLPGLSRDDASVKMFLAEARFGSVLNHPNIVQIVDLGQVEDVYYIALEFVDGPDLHSLLMRALEREQPMSTEMVAWIAARVAAGLHHAHEAHDPETGQALNLVHRDVNHANILVSRHGEVKITDFGIAKVPAIGKGTASGVLKGKIGYMAPEQCLERPVDRRTDIFCLGVVMYELLTGRRLFRGENDLDTMRRVVHQPIGAPSRHADGADPGLDAIVLQCLARPHDQRPATASLVGDRLAAWLMARGARAVRAQLRRWIGDNALDLCPSTRFGGRGRARQESQTAGMAEPGLDAFANTARQRNEPEVLAELESMEEPTARDSGVPAMLELEWAYEAPTLDLDKDKR